MTTIDFAKNFHHINQGNEQLTNQIIKVIVSFIITFVIKYVLAQNKDIGPILMETLKFTLVKFITMFIVGLIYLDIIIPLFYGTNFKDHVKDNKFVKHSITNEILKNIEMFLIIIVFYFVNKFINSIGNTDKPFAINDILNVTLDQLLTMKSFTNL